MIIWIILIISFYLTMFKHLCQTKYRMNNYQIIYKTTMVTSFASCSLKAKHNISWWVLKLIIQKCTPTYTIITSWVNKWQTSWQLQVGKWMKLLNYPQNMTCCKIQQMCLIIRHPLSSPTQWIGNHCYKIQTNTSWEISNCNFILLLVWILALNKIL